MQDYYDMDTRELLECLFMDFQWLRGALGRFNRLLEIKAPLPILTNELDTWKAKVEEIRDILRTGRVGMTSAMEDAWRGIQVEYETLPDKEDVLLELGPDYKRMMGDS